jgi:hypothetical protein
MKLPKVKPNELKEIGFSVFRFWTRYYKCFGFVDSKKNHILYYQCDIEGNVIEDIESCPMDWPMKIWDKENNFEIFKK